MGNENSFLAEPASIEKRQQDELARKQDQVRRAERSALWKEEDLINKQRSIFTGSSGQEDRAAEIRKRLAEIEREEYARAKEGLAHLKNKLAAVQKPRSEILHENFERLILDMRHLVELTKESEDTDLGLVPNVDEAKRTISSLLKQIERVDSKREELPAYKK